MNIKLDYGQSTLSLSFRSLHHSFNASIRLKKHLSIRLSRGILSVKITPKNWTYIFLMFFLLTCRRKNTSDI